MQIAIEKIDFMMNESNEAVYLFKWKMRFTVVIDMSDGEWLAEVGLSWKFDFDWFECFMKLLEIS